MRRWILLIFSFILIFVLSLWSYIYIYRVEFTKLMLSSALPNEEVSIKEVQFSKNSVLFKEIALSQKGGSQPYCTIPNAQIFFTPFSLCLWALNPLPKAIPLNSVSIEIGDLVLPAPSHLSPLKHQIEPITFEIDVFSLFFGSFFYEEKQLHNISIQKIVEIVLDKSKALESKDLKEKFLFH